MEILEKEIRPGASVQLKMSIAKLHTNTIIEVPVFVERAATDGPCLLLVGGIHGNEFNGVEIVRRLVAGDYHVPDRGTVICIPVLNVFGFLNQQREFPDGRDLNRVFPGSAHGSLASRFANFMMEEIMPHVDYVIDYHTGGDGRFNYPQLRIGENNEEVLELARVFGTKFIKFAKHREKSFREIVNSMGKKILLFEGGKTLSLDPKVTLAGMQGAINVMHRLRMLDERSVLKKAPDNQVVIRSSTWVRAKYSGMFRSSIKLGSYVRKGEMIGTVSDPYGTFEKPVKAPNDGYLFCLEQSTIVNQGTALAHISTLVDEKK